jgi:hypothetical protein
MAWACIRVPIIETKVEDVNMDDENPLSKGKKVHGTGTNESLWSRNKCVLRR